ncbi:uncharacterized protein LOC122625499 [Drosophila teissieri]|uniref:uncharacterized protein LOC122625499 n=1 Tax=Drosophila teissieri TaxID=7243 RepID=UPI001CBA3B8E|nr:uncharacterized protein LOC122625499 [Drosophila teissieri]
MDAVKAYKESQLKVETLEEINIPSGSKLSDSASARSSSPVDNLVQLVDRRADRVRQQIGLIYETLDSSSEIELVKQLAIMKSHWSNVTNTLKLLENKYDRTAFDQDEADILQSDVAALEMVLQRKLEQFKSSNYAVPELPKVDLPTFNGNAKEWPTFYELFSELIDSRKDLSNTRKLGYLRACLKGEAQMVVSHLITRSAASYAAAWELICKRYENSRKIFSQHFNKLMELECLLPHDEKNLGKFLDTATESIFIIKQKGKIGSSADVILAEILLRKFSPEALQLYEQHVKKARAIQSLQDVLEFIEQQYNSVNAITKNTAQLATRKVQVRSCTFCS